MGKNVLLIYPRAGFEAEHVNIHMPMSLMCLAAPLVREGVKVTILDQRVEKNFHEKLKESLQDDPICVGISSKTGTQISYALECANLVRQNSKVPLVWGGVHPTLTADQTIRNKFVDFVVRGEGEVTFQKLIDALAQGGDFARIEGISWKKGTEVIHNPDREFCDLDSLAPLPYDLINVEKYIVPQVPGRSRCLDVYASRGCPRKCTFCYNSQFNKSSYRMKNIDKVIAEIKWLVKTYSLDSVCINDDNFSVDIERTHYFCRRLLEENIGIEWAAKGMEIWRVANMDLDLLERSGCRRIYMGIESGSEKILRFLNRSDTLSGIKAVVKKFSGSKIVPHYNFIMGFPTEGIAELEETLALADYIIKTDPKAYFSSFHIFTPFPGARLTQLVEERYGFVSPSRLEDWAGFRMEAIVGPWISEEMKKIYLNINMITYFIDDKFSDRINKNIFLKIFSKFFSVCARYRWKKKQFRNCPEFRILSCLAESKVKRKIRQVNKDKAGLVKGNVPE